MGAPSPDLCNLWLARAFNAQDVDAAAAMYHPDASIVQVDEVHGLRDVGEVILAFVVIEDARFGSLRFQMP